MTYEELNEAAPRIGDTQLFGWSGGAGDLTGRSLADISRQIEPDNLEDTPMVRRAKAAWATPLDALTCDQGLLLLGQGMGVPWLAGVICHLVRLSPYAEVTFYPGDLTLCALREFKPLFECDPPAARSMLALETDWMEAAWGYEDGPLTEGLQALAEARRIAGV